MLNRCSVLVRIKEPNRSWAANVDDSGVVPALDTEPSLYLIPEYRNDSEAWELIEEGYDAIFRAELFAWHTDEAGWPENRTFSMFRDWFELTLASIVVDLCEGPIVED